MDRKKLPENDSSQPDSNIENPIPQPAIRSLRELIDLVTGRRETVSSFEENSGLAEKLPFPFLGLVGQAEMKLALLLALINPAIGGVLLIGPRGTGKTTAVRSLLDLLPEVQRSTCYYGCLPEDIETGGMDAVCPDCAKKYAQGIPLVNWDCVNLVELPLNVRLEDVIGGLDERALIQERLRLKRGLLAQSDQNILYIDEVNLLSDEIVDAILDAAAQGTFTVRRGPISATYNARFTLIGSMNPEEGSLRPQIFDRFGLRVIVKGLKESKDRKEAYERVMAYRTNPRQVIADFSVNTDLAKKEIQNARNLLPDVTIPDDVALAGIKLTQLLKIDSLRAEISLFEAARAYAAGEGSTQVGMSHIREVALMALRFRRSSFMLNFYEEQAKEENELTQVLDSLGTNPLP